MGCQGTIGPYGFRCFFHEHQRHWRPCCDIREADEQLEAYIYHVSQSNTLAALTTGERYYRRAAVWRPPLRRDEQLAPDGTGAPYNLEEL